MGIKCVCGYRYIEDSGNKNLDDMVKKIMPKRMQKKFIRIKGSFHNSKDDSEVFLFACPECGTVQMSKF